MNGKEQRRDGRRGVATTSAKRGSVEDAKSSSMLSSIPGFDGLTEMMLPCQRELKYVVATATSSSYRHFQATDANRNSGIARETNSPGSPGVSAVPPPKEAISPISVADIPHETLTQHPLMSTDPPPLGQIGIKIEEAKTKHEPDTTQDVDAMVSRETLVENCQESSSDVSKIEKAFSEFLRQNPSFGLSSSDTSSMLRQKLIKMTQDKARAEAELTSQIQVIMKSKKDMEEELEGQLKKLMGAKSARRQKLIRQIVAAEQSMRATEESMKGGMIFSNVETVNKMAASWSHGHRFASPHHQRQADVHGTLCPSLLSDGDSSLDGGSGSALELNYLESVDEEEEYNRSYSSGDERDNTNKEMRQEKEDRTDEANLSNVGPRERASSLSGTPPRNGTSCDPDTNKKDEEFEPDQSSTGDEGISALEEDLHQFKIDNALLTTEMSLLKKQLEAQDTKSAGLAQAEGVLGQLDGDSGELLSSTLQVVKSKVDKVETDGHDTVSRMRGDAEFYVTGLNSAQGLIPNEHQAKSYPVNQETLGIGRNSENAGGVLFPPSLTLQEKRSPDEFAAQHRPEPLSNLEPTGNASRDEVPALPMQFPMATGGHDAISIPGDAEEIVGSTQNSSRSRSQDNAWAHSVPQACCGEIQTSHAAMAPTPSFPQVTPTLVCLEQNRSHVIPVIEDDTQSYEGAKYPPTDETIVGETGQEEHEVTLNTEEDLMADFCAATHRPSQSSKELHCVPQRPLSALPKQEEQSKTAATEHQNTLSFYNHTHHEEKNEEEMLDVMKELVPKRVVRADRGGSGRRTKPAPEMGLTAPRVVRGSPSLDG